MLIEPIRKDPRRQVMLVRMEKCIKLYLILILVHFVDLYLIVVMLVLASLALTLQLSEVEDCFIPDDHFIQFALLFYLFFLVFQFYYFGSVLCPVHWSLLWCIMRMVWSTFFYVQVYAFDLIFTNVMVFFHFLLF